MTSQPTQRGCSSRCVQESTCPWMPRAGVGSARGIQGGGYRQGHRVPGPDCIRRNQTSSVEVPHTSGDCLRLPQRGTSPSDSVTAIDPRAAVSIAVQHRHLEPSHAGARGQSPMNRSCSPACRHLSTRDAEHRVGFFESNGKRRPTTSDHDTGCHAGYRLPRSAC
jgi:hypothetical protein